MFENDIKDVVYAQEIADIENGYKKQIQELNDKLEKLSILADNRSSFINWVLENHKEVAIEYLERE